MDQNRSKQVQESEERFRKVFEEGPLGIVLLGLDARIQHCNHRFCEMLDYSEEEIIALGLADISHPEDWRKDFELGSRLLNGEIPNYTIEKRYIRKGGVVFWGQLTASIMHDAEDKPTTIISMVEDISERKRAEERLRNSERTLRTLIDASPESILLMDTDGVVLIANETLAHRLGKTVNAITDHMAYDFLPADIATSRRRHIAEVVRTGKPTRFEDQRSGRYFDNVVCPVLDEHGKVAAVALLGIDQTERRQAEAALRESEERYRTLAESTTDVIAIHDRNGTLLYSNQAGAAHFGFDPRSTIGTTQQEPFSPEMAGKHTDAIAEVFKTGELFETDGVYNLDSGDIWLNTRLIPLRDEHGQVTSVMSVSRNITKRKQAEQALKKAHDELERRVEERTAELTNTNERLQQEIEERRRAAEALRQSEDKYRALIEASPDAILMTDMEQNILFASQRLADLFGYPSTADLCKQKASALVAEEERQRLVGNMSLLVQEGVRRQIEYIGVRRDGSRFIGEVSSAVLRDDKGEPKGLMAVVRDITERKRAEEALRRSEERFRSYFEQGLMGMAISEGGTNWTEVNDRFCDILGYSREEVVQRKGTDFIHPDDVESARRDYGRLVAGEADHYTKDRRYVRKDGTVIYFTVFFKMFRSEKGTAGHVLGLFDDVTERRLAQELLQREHQTLKHLLESSDHERQLIAYEIHDELAQQLAGAIMQFETYAHLKDKKPRPAAKAYDAGMTMLQQGHSEARRLIAGVRPPILDESGVVAAIGHLVHEQNRLKGPKIDCHSRVDFDRLVQILENGIYRIIQEGLANSCQHSQSERVRVTLLQRKDRVQIEVRDWGIGFDVRAKHENRFGLEGIRQRARLLGGKCSIRSKPGKGTRLVVELPVVVRE